MNLDRVEITVDDAQTRIQVFPESTTGYIVICFALLIALVIVVVPLSIASIASVARAATLGSMAVLVAWLVLAFGFVFGIAVELLWRTRGRETWSISDAGVEFERCLGTKTVLERRSPNSNDMSLSERRFTKKGDELVIRQLVLTSNGRLTRGWGKFSEGDAALLRDAIARFSGPKEPKLAT